jgi:hypothetical protein
MCVSLMRNFVLITLDKNSYTNTVIGSDRVYFNAYPYKVKLSDNSITYTWQSASTINDWFKPQYPGDTHWFRRNSSTKRVNNWARNFYFSDKSIMDEFVSSFSDTIEYIAGPISNEHVTALNVVNSQSKTDETISVIKGNYYFNEYDMKFIWRWPVDLESRLFDDSNSLSQYWDNLGIAINEMTEQGSRNFYRNVYLHSDDMEEIEFFCKLKFGDVIHQKVKILLIENL